ncbi:MAG TPA: patatin-like phospholipase family protein [Burkholderiales bacterium]|nr:patatin-like phospholipase family protein [Burkholderiales bacterium]
MTSISRSLNLALQGGGALGALTWGVLDRLLDERRLRIEAISGTSAGAMNAVALASGWMAGGRRGAQKALADFWTDVGNAGQSIPAVSRLMIDLSRLFAPRQLNPFDINPLRKIIADRIDFAALRSRRAIRLFVAATRLKTGSLKLFENRELSVDALLASACLPTLNQAIEIDGEAYWDGGYSGNPALYPLLYRCRTPDILVVRLQPFERAELPRTADDIRARMTDFQFNATFLREMRGFALAKRAIEKQWLPLGGIARRLKRMNFHLVEADDLIGAMRMDKALHATPDFLLKLKDEGRNRADAWLERNAGHVGRQSTIDLDAFA